jgi:membrane-associated protease RseP (regulator of RpoE activity)
MKFRGFLIFVVSLALTSIVALAQQKPAPPAQAPEAPPAPGEPFGPNFSLFFAGGGSFLGVHAEDINKENSARYGLRDVRGVGITSVVKDSPAERAGLKKDDVIVRFDGENVTSVRKLNRLVSEVAPDQTVRLGISRGGAEQEIAVTIAKRKDNMNAMHGMEGEFGPGGEWRIEGPEGLKTLKGLKHLKDWENLGSDQEGFVLAFGNSRRIGISTTQLTKQLADYFGVPDGKGVLVSSVADDSPAAKAGIKAGDVITAIDGEKLEGAGDLARAINRKKDGDVTLTVIRNKSQRTITVTPKARTTGSGQPETGSQVGRRVIIPRIELPSIPEMNIIVPRINLPTIPEINVNIQGVPRRVKVSQPI